MSEAAPKTLWERATSGIATFSSYAVGYIPRGIAVLGTVFAGSAILEGMTGGSLGLGVAGWSPETLATRGALHLALGMGISGVIGTTMGDCACPPGKEGQTNAPANPLVASSEEAKMGQQITQEIGSAAVNHGLQAVPFGQQAGAALRQFSRG